MMIALIKWVEMLAQPILHIRVCVCVRVYGWVFVCRLVNRLTVQASNIPLFLSRSRCDVFSDMILNLNGK